MKLTLLLTLLLSFQFSFAFTHLQPVKPNEAQTPGEVCTTKNPDFSEFRYAEKIPYCKRNVSTRTKNGVYRSYGVNLKNKKAYTIDHLIPLSIGGTNSVKNLWPEPKSIKDLRYNLELEIYYAVKSGDLTQAEAIEIVLDAKFNPQL